jgi:outer membrane lipoprotein-sorting protein
MSAGRGRALPHLTRRRARLLALPVALLLAACPRSAQHARPAAPAAPDARLAAIRAREDALHTLRARFTAVTRMPDVERSADGVLLVAKPDRFRLRLLLPFGITVCDYLTVGERSWIALPLADARQREQLGEFAPFSRDDLGAAFLRGRYAFPGECEAVPAAGDDVWVRCREADALRRTLLITGDVIAEETSYNGDSPRMAIRYSDYRDVDGMPLPFHIALSYPQHQQSVDITIQRYEVNPPLADGLFLPTPDSLPVAPAEGGV